MCEQPIRRRVPQLRAALLGLALAAAGASAGHADDATGPAAEAAQAVDVHPWIIVHSFKPDTNKPDTDLAALGCPAPQEKTANDARLISLELEMNDVAVVCQLLRDYGGRTDVPLKLLDTYEAKADKAWRQQIADACAAKTDAGVGICARDISNALPDGIDPRDTEGRSGDDDPTRTEIYRDWNRPDRTLIEFEWTPCTPYLVGRGWDRWRQKHLNIAVTGTEPSGKPMPPEGLLPNPEYKKIGVGKLGSADPVTIPVLQNVCFKSATVRTALRERWANFAKVALREDLAPITEEDPDCADCGLRYAGAYPANKYPHSRVTDITWKNTWLDRQQWLVLARDHFLARLRTEGLDPNYKFPGTARLVYCGPEVRYGGVPSGKQYYWRKAQPGDKENCNGWRPKGKTVAPADGYKELTVSFDPDATMILSRGPAYHQDWDREQSRLVGRAVERLARYKTASPLVQNDSEPNALADCKKPLPGNGDGGRCNAEAPRRDAVSPRFGDVFEGAVAEAPSEPAPK